MNRRLDILVATLLVLAISPVFLVALPAMSDYPNHLARMYVLATAGTPDANPFYEVRNALYPNMAMDLLVPPLGRLIGVDLAAKVFLVACQLLIVTGAIALEFAVKRRHELAGLAGVVALYSFPFAWAFLNFEFGLGIALWGLAAWEYLRKHHLIMRLAVHCLFVAAIYLSHLFALALYAATAGFFELARLERPRLTDAAVRLVVLAIPMFAVFALMLGTGDVGSGPTKWSLLSKILSIFWVLNGYSEELAAVESAILIATCYILFRTGGIRLSRTGIFVFVGIVLIFIATPFRLLGTAYVDVRVPIAALLILPAFTRVNLSSRGATVAAAIMAGIACVNVALTSAVWFSYQDDFAELRRSFTLLDRPSKVLVGRTIDGSAQLLEQPIHHVPALAVSAKVMVTTLAAFPGMQPISVKPEYREQSNVDVAHYGPIPMSTLQLIANEIGLEKVPRFLKYWPREFDFLYLVGPPTTNPLPNLLQELARGKLFVLYRISTPRRETQ